jgi:hypothetical protein
MSQSGLGVEIAFICRDVQVIVYIPREIEGKKEKNRWGYI